MDAGPKEALILDLHWCERAQAALLWLGKDRGGRCGSEVATVVGDVGSTRRQGQRDSGGGGVMGGRRC